MPCMQSMSNRNAKRHTVGKTYKGGYIVLDMFLQKKRSVNRKHCVTSTYAWIIKGTRE